MVTAGRARIVLGTRRSRLARAQTRRVAERLEETWPGLEVEVRGITTEGDRVLDRPLPEIGGKGVFTAELEVALLEGEIDLAVHSLKDLPTDLGASFSVLGVPEREDPRDVLLLPGGPGRLEELAEESVVGTSSLRRTAQLRARRPDCKVESVRGNVETRIQKMESGRYDAVILAAAGLRRLGLLGREGGHDAPGGGRGEPALLEAPGWLPAPGQGAIGLEGRAGDEETRRLARALEEPSVRTTVEAERSLLATLQGGCQVPIGALASWEEGVLRLDAVVLAEDGSREIRATGRTDLARLRAEGPGAVSADRPGGERSDLRREARTLGRRVAEDLLDRGAGEILGAIAAAGDESGIA